LLPFSIFVALGSTNLTFRDWDCMSRNNYKIINARPTKEKIESLDTVKEDLIKSEQEIDLLRKKLDSLQEKYDYMTRQKEEQAKRAKNYWEQKENLHDENRDLKEKNKDLMRELERLKKLIK
jgi:hypothetical protein